MTASFFATATSWSYGLALAAYIAFAGRMALGWRKSSRASMLMGTILATAVWAGACIVVAVAATPARLAIADAADALRYATWFVLVGSLVYGDAMASLSRIPRWVVAFAALALILAVALSEGLPFAARAGLSPRAEFAVRIGLAVFGLALAEQLYRRAHAQARWAIKPLCLALGGVFGYELFLYADAMLFARVDADIWVARGVANALVVPFIAIATARNVGWTIEMHLSRGAIFYSTSLLVSGVFLLAVSGAGYIVRYFGGDWGAALQIELVFAGLLFVLLVATSGRFRSRLRVFVSKHFFSYRYDYREEWLRFNRTLSTDATSQNVQERTIAALANLVESPAGALWLKLEDGGYAPASRWNMPAVEAVEPADGSLARFLARSGWVVSLPEFEADRSKYLELELPGWLAAVASPWLIVPLSSRADLIGFVVLGSPRAAIEVNWEVRDLLKTASQQAASFLGQIRAAEALIEARKFDAFNRMSAFVVHDLKNLVAQLSLMLRNAERHRDNPEFQRDMLTTVEHVVGRMNGLMLQLRTGTTPVEKPRQVDLEALVRRVSAAKIIERRPIRLELRPACAIGHEDRLEHVIGHLVQNALDATASSGEVAVRISREKGKVQVEVRDTGTGMSAEFVRERLFKPFESTKGEGMGIGVYESLQYVKSIGGDIRVESAPGAGTSIQVLLPEGAAAAGRPDAGADGGVTPGSRQEVA
jgi:putative PEP-CTERM system histidine kinase